MRRLRLRPSAAGRAAFAAATFGLAPSLAAAGTLGADPADVQALVNTTKLPILAVETVSILGGDIEDQKWARYFTLLDISQVPSFSTREDEVWVLARSGMEPDGVRNVFVQMWTDGTADAPLRPNSKPFVPMNDHTVSHNLGAIVTADGSLVVAGGMYSRPETFDRMKSYGLYGKYSYSNGGIYVWSTSSLADATHEAGPALPEEVQGMGPVRESPPWLREERSLSAVPGNHPGCVEKREHFEGHCAFDGRVSLVRHRGMWLLFARANTVFKGGGRYVQVTAASSLSGPWHPFKLIAVESYDEKQIEEGNIYSAALNTNPADTDTLLGVFPLIKGSKAYISVALSCDGVHFSRFKHVLTSDIVPPRGNERGGNRGIDHPVDGILVRNNTVYLYVQRNVPGIAAARPSRIIRLALTRAALAAWTQQKRSQLQERGVCGSMADAWIPAELAESGRPRSEEL